MLMGMTQAKATRDPHPDGPVASPASTAAFDAGEGEMPSWSELVAEHADRVYRLAYQLSGNQQDAEDLTQETFMRVFRSLKHYRPGTFEGWLHRITTNLFLDMVRHRSKIRMEALEEYPEHWTPAASAEPTPERAYELNNLDPALEEALADLQPEYRVALVLRDGLDMSYDEIAVTLGVKLGTVRSRIHRARAQMKAKLVENQGELHYVGS